MTSPGEMSPAIMTTPLSPFRRALTTSLTPRLTCFAFDALGILVSTNFHSQKNLNKEKKKCSDGKQSGQHALLFPLKASNKLTLFDGLENTLVQLLWRQRLGKGQQGGQSLLVVVDITGIGGGGLFALGRLLILGHDKLYALMNLMK